MKDMQGCIDTVACISVTGDMCVYDGAGQTGNRLLSGHVDVKLSKIHAYELFLTGLLYT